MESVIFQASPVQCSCVTEFAKRLWPEHTKSKLEEEFRSVLSLPTCAVFLLQLDQKAVGFAQCSLRYEYVKGTKHSPVGYLEEIYVLEEYRRRGFGSALVHRCEKLAVRSLPATVTGRTKKVIGFICTMAFLKQIKSFVLQNKSDG